jgi:large subunit ribosomal protein L23
MNASHLVITPRISEQTYAMSETGTYVFEVPTKATKQMIKAGIENQFGVTVTGVNTTVLKGKSMPSARKRQQAIYGNRKSIKKAYVNLAKGDKIKIFEEGQ